MHLVNEKYVVITTCVCFVKKLLSIPNIFQAWWKVTDAKVSECYEEKNMTEGGQEAVLTKNTIPGETNFEFRRDGNIT